MEGQDKIIFTRALKARALEIERAQEVEIILARIYSSPEFFKEFLDAFKRNELRILFTRHSYFIDEKSLKEWQELDIDGLCFAHSSFQKKNFKKNSPELIGSS